MALSLPLAVRLKTASADRYVTRGLRDLTFRSTAPGGFASCTLSFDRPLDTQPPEIDYYGTVYVYDKRSGATVWEGRLEDPGRTAGDGEIWQVTAVGPSAHAQDRTVPLIYVDQSISDGWIRAGTNLGGIDQQVSVTSDPAGVSFSQAIVFRIDTGVGSPGEFAEWRYQRIANAGMKMARFDYTWGASATDANFALKGIARGSNTIARTDTFNVGGGASNPKVVVTDFTNGDTAVDLQAIYTGIGGSPLVRWCSVPQVFILGLRFNKDGTEKTSGYTTNSVLASDVVADLLGRLLTDYDGANASVATTSYAIDSLAYPEGISADTLLSDMMILEPSFYWAAWESGVSGLNRFEWSQWPTTVRYEATVYDGFDSPGSAVDLFNAVRVRYTDVTGALANTRRTQTVTALTNAGLTREGLLDLTVSQGRHSLGYAQRAGDQWLAERAVPPNAGTLTVARPIRDLTTGATVQPWEIRPGNLIRVRGVLPRVDALNPTARDGVTVFRVSAVEFQAASASARLELDSYPRTVARALSLLGKHR